MSQSLGTLYVVATPIGNLGDMVPRAVQVLQSVALIACEDTRHSARLLEHFAITGRCVAYHDHSDDKRTEQILAQLQAGEEVALISDAGTPLVSDPGYRLVRAARQVGVRVVPIPGACAFVAALSAAGLPSNRFTFEGFLPAKAGARLAALEALADEPRTLIFYEAPHRVLACVQDMARAFGLERELVMAREISKTFETIYTACAGDMAEWIAADSNQQRGEIVLLVHGAPERNVGMSAEAERVMRILLDELPVKQAAALGAKLTGAKKNELYQWALANRAD
ncbi:16S rRNA (cytidine(1402)-2'-O)-methyltransferase [Gilvimarinus agarilyticus]|uniref:16S rRNA (cytidine(1402)-2'-O)-methyltransferase n=1 Tax=Gilvimarinus agarilyticus TaxID=679259 RepID=UPI0005A2E340|nr:16S rRNA (cytidine(1402)-2'-O)-methyltransferase [Gilvimarinus agarilyticus]